MHIGADEIATPRAAESKGALMTVIRQDDFIRSIADALQFISYYHPVDFVRAMGNAYE